MKRIASWVPAAALAALALSGCAASSSASCFTFSAAVAEDAVGAPTAREALNVWVSGASGSTRPPASQWVQTTNASDDAVRFQAEGDWVRVTRITNGWMVMEGGNCAD